MKWTLPKDGERRIVRKFALFPKLMLVQDDESPKIKIWLEHYYSYQRSSWDGKWYEQFSLQYFDDIWLATGKRGTKSERVRGRLGVK